MMTARVSAFLFLALFATGLYPAAAAASGECALAYVWSDSLAVALDYMDQLGEVLGEETIQELHVVRHGQRRDFGIVFEYEGSCAGASVLAARQDTLLAMAGFDSTSVVRRAEYFELHNISYGVGPNLEAQKYAFRKVSRLLGADVARDLVIEQLGDGRYALVYKRLGDIESTAKVMHRHRRIMQRNGLDAAVIREQYSETVYGEASGLHEELAGPEPDEPAAGDTAAIDSASVAAEANRTPPSPTGQRPRPGNGLDSALEARIEGHVKELRRRGVIGADEKTAWSVYDFHSNEKLVSINEDHAFQAASMIKPFVALAFFHRVARGELKYGPKSKRNMRLMIQRSSNSATNWVMRQVGGPAAVQRILRNHYPGIFTHTRIVEYIPAGGRTYRNKASAHDYSRFLYALWREGLPYSRELKRLMALPGSDRIYRGVPNIPQGTLVYDKTGTTAQLVGDMGILVVRDRNGGRYPYTLIGIIEKPKRARGFSTFVQRRGDVIREISGIVYDEMRRRHRLR